MTGDCCRGASRRLPPAQLCYPASRCAGMFWSSCNIIQSAVLLLHAMYCNRSRPYLVAREPLPLGHNRPHLCCCTAPTPPSTPHVASHLCLLEEMVLQGLLSPRSHRRAVHGQATPLLVLRSASLVQASLTCGRLCWPHSDWAVMSAVGSIACVSYGTVAEAPAIGDSAEAASPLAPAGYCSRRAYPRGQVARRPGCVQSRGR
jgi:hypothetical protein